MAIHIGSLASSHQGARTSGSSLRRQTNLNQNMAWAIIATLALVALPFGSVYGFSWGFFAALVGILTIVYTLALGRIGGIWRYPLSQLKLAAAIFAVMLAYLIVQMMPLGLLLGSFDIVASSAATLSSSTISVASDMTFLMLMRQLSYGLFFFLVLQVSVNDARRRFLFDAILIMVVAYGVLGIISLQMGDTVLGFTKKAYQGSATGSFINRNSFATFLGFGSLIALAQIGRRIVDQSERHPDDGRIVGNTSAIALYAVAYVLLIAVLVATQSRMGLAASLTGALVVVSVILVRSVKARRALVMMASVGMVAIALGAALFGDALFDRMFDLETAGTTRTELYAQVVQLIEQRPLIGYGGGAFELAFPLVHQAPVSSAYTWDKAHNTYLTLWSELGLVFGSLPILVGLFVAFRLIGSLRQGRETWMGQTIALGTLVLAGMHSLVDFSLEIQANTFLFITIVAAGVSAARPSTR